MELIVKNERPTPKVGRLALYCDAKGGVMKVSVTPGTWSLLMA